MIKASCKYALLLVTSFILPACKKDKEEKADITVTVISELTGKPLENTKVTLKEHYNNPSSFGLSGSGKIIGTYLTDSQGKTNFVFYRKKNNRYWYSVSVLNDYSQWSTYKIYGNHSNGYSLSSDDASIQSYLCIISPNAYIKFTFHDTLPFDNADVLKVLYVNQFKTDYLFMHINSTYDWPHYREVPCSEPIILKCEATKNNITSTFYDTVYAKPFEKLEHTINW